MKNSEIRSLVEEAKADIAYCEEHIKSLPMYDFKMTMRLTSAIETLLAREAEVLDMLPEPPDGYMSETQYARAQLGDQIRAILNPEENSNG
jgi:hypothetical protein